jgi:hypothetical protein
MWIQAQPKIDRPLPVWEHGYRCHGYWLEDPRQRVGHVGLTPPGYPLVYSWAIDATEDRDDLSPCRGECTTLRAAKRKVEAAFRELYSWRFPASRGY